MSKTYVNPNIEIVRPKKKKRIGYTVTVDKNNLDYLTIKAKRHDGKSLGNAGKIMRDGTTVIVSRHMSNLKKFIDKSVQNKIDTVLDLVYGVNRTKEIVLNQSAGGSVIEFRK